MARIVVAWHNQLLFANPSARACFLDAFLDGLKMAGNDILLFEKSYFMKTVQEAIPQQYLEKIQSFNPDLFIFFNNQFWDISKLFDVPIIIYDVDSPNVFCNLEELQRNKSRYKYIVNQSDGQDIIHSRIGCDLKDIIYIPPYTNIQSVNCKQDINISFCGSPWMFNDFDDFMLWADKDASFNDKKMAIKVFQEFVKNPQKNLEQIYSELNLQPEKDMLIFKNIQIVAARIAGARRLRYLSEIYDLGLEVHGYLWNQPMLKPFPEVMLTYSKRPVYNTETTQELYNRSKIGFNTKHLQAKSGFSWRVCDILASNACLVTESSSDLKLLGFNVPEFSNTTEARELCQKILKEDNLRRDIVLHSQSIINKYHRFDKVLPLIEDFLNIKLHTNRAGTVEQIILYPKNSLFPSYTTGEFKNITQKICYKLAKYFYKRFEKFSE